MNALYPELEVIARALLQEFGQTMTLKRESAPQYNIATGQYDTQPETWKGFGAAFAFDARELNGHTVVQGDVKIYLERIATTPQVGDTLEANGKTWRVKNVAPISPAAWDVIYVLQVGV